MHLARGLRVRQEILDRRLDYEQATLTDWVSRLVGDDSVLLGQVAQALVGMPWIAGLLQTRVMFRLQGLTQWGVCARGYPSVRVGLDASQDVVNEIGAPLHDRFTHSVQVAAAALVLGVRLKLPPQDLKTLVLAAFLHDVGHSPYAHDGDRILKAFGQPLHEERGQLLVLRDPQLLRIFQEARVSPHHVVRTMREEGRLGQLLSLVDTASYVGMDMRMCGAIYPPRETFLILLSVVGVKKGCLIVNSREPIRRLLDDRALLGQEVYCTERSSFVNEATHVLWREVFRRRLLDISVFARMTDVEASIQMEHFWPQLCVGDPRLISVRELSLGICDRSSWKVSHYGRQEEALLCLAELQAGGTWSFVIGPRFVGRKQIMASRGSGDVAPIQAEQFDMVAPHSDWRVWSVR